MKEIVALRVERTEAGKKFPFDVAYFFNNDLEDLLARIFRSGVVMPVTKTMKADIRAVCVKTKPEMHLHPFDRNDAAESTEDPSDYVLHVTSKDLMFVPILFTRRGRVTAEQAEEQSKLIFPLYFAANSGASKKKNIASILSNRAYLLFNKKKIRPVCLACPLHMLAIVGRCEAKLEECYKQITCTAPSTFGHALKKYNELASRVCEPEIKNGRIHTNPD